MQLSQPVGNKRQRRGTASVQSRGKKNQAQRRYAGQQKSQPVQEGLFTPPKDQVQSKTRQKGVGHARLKQEPRSRQYGRQPYSLVQQARRCQQIQRQSVPAWHRVVFHQHHRRPGNEGRCLHHRGHPQAFPSSSANAQRQQVARQHKHHAEDGLVGKEHGVNRQSRHVPHAIHQFVVER